MAEPSEQPESAGAGDDVRMRGFARRVTVEAAIAWVDAQTATLPPETVGLFEAAGRVLAAPVTSTVDVPGFDRAMMDGFAVLAADTQGASAYQRMPLAILGEALPGRPFAGRVAAGQAVRIMTGTPMPAGADAVLPAEQVEIAGGRVLVQGDVPPGKHIGLRGEDIRAGTVVLTAGRRLRPQDIGVLSSIGMAEVPVVRRPRVAMVMTGDELLPPGTPAEGCRIADANGPMLAALVARDGGVVSLISRVPDRPEPILAAMRAGADVVLVSGGSSVGQEDYAAQLIAEHGELAIHGIAMRPSSPTGMGRLDGQLVFLLPGNPVSCLCAYDFFAGRAIRAMAGRSTGWPYRRMTGTLRRKISSVVGRLDYARVRVVEGAVEPLAIAGASILTSTTRADGFVLVPADSEGYPAGATVEVFLYEDVP
ncbi:MAG: molybdopterin molybdotransferase MoeA [Pirellulales bacterium]